MPDEPPAKKGSTFVAMAGIGSEMVGSTLVGVFLDWMIDSLPVFTVLLTVTGLAVAMWHLSKWAKARSRP